MIDLDKIECHHKNVLSQIEKEFPNKELTKHEYENRKYKRDIYGRKMGEVKKVNGNENKQSDTDEKKDVATECFDMFLHTAFVNEQCDRVLTNHSKLTKRFNLDNMVRKCPLTEAALKDCVL